MIAVIATSLDDGGGGNHSSSSPARVDHRPGARGVPKVHVVQSGDTLTSIAHETGVPVARILRLNPGVDPQILIAGEKLKLK